MRDFSNLDDRRLFEGVKDTFRSYIRRYARSSSCFPFYNEILNRLRQSFLKIRISMRSIVISSLKLIARKTPFQSILLPALAI